MTEFSMPWTGINYGDSGPYDADDWCYLTRLLYTTNPQYQGVISRYLNELSPSLGGGPLISVASGAAIVHGTYYENTATVNLSMTAPISGTNYYTIVLRKVWATQTVRLAIVGPSTVTYPSTTQQDGYIWEIPIAHCSITSFPASYVTDIRWIASMAKSPRKIFISMWKGNQGPLTYFGPLGDKSFYVSETYGGVAGSGEDGFVYFDKAKYPSHCKMYLHIIANDTVLSTSWIQLYWYSNSLGLGGYVAGSKIFVPYNVSVATYVRGSVDFYDDIPYSMPTDMVLEPRVYVESGGTVYVKSVAIEINLREA